MLEIKNPTKLFERLSDQTSIKKEVYLKMRIQADKKKLDLFEEEFRSIKGLVDTEI